MFEGIMGSEELDTIVELLIAVLFMGVCAVMVGGMCIRMSAYSTHLHCSDKTEITAEKNEVEEPFYYTGYQAYMFAWMMDSYSKVPITWLADNDARIDSSNNDHVTIGTIDEDGSSRNQFMAWRNQVITGGALARNRNVKDVLRDAASGAGTIDNFYSGNTEWRYHLVFTGDYTLSTVPVYSDVGYTLVERKKVYSWVLVPIRLTP